MNKELDEEELMTMYISGDEQAFKELFARYRGRVYGYLSKRIQDSRTVDDLFQTVFLNVHRSRRSYEPSLLFSAWIFSICRNVVNDYFRSERRQLKKSDENMESIIEDKGTLGLEHNLLEDVIASMPLKQQEAITLRYAQNLDFEEIARRLKTTESNVRKIISRAVKTIRKEI